MKGFKCFSLLLIATLWFSGCASQEMGQFFGGMAGAVLEGTVAGLAGTEPDGSITALFAQLGAAAGLENEARQAGVNLVLVPANWRGSGGKLTGQLVKDERGRFCYVLGEDYLVWDPAEKCWLAED